jgi:hypothetical protein
VEIDCENIEQTDFTAVIEAVLAGIERAVLGPSAQPQPCAVFDARAGNAPAAVLVAVGKTHNRSSQLRAPRLEFAKGAE